MDEPARAAHDSRQASSANGAGWNPTEPGAPPQLQPEDLGAPPPTARPFAYVDKEPQPQTPAGRASLARGDAVLRLGDATHLRDVQGQLQAHIHRPMPVVVIDLQGRLLKKWVTPQSWDPWAPGSLLGCQLASNCPLDLAAVHPVLVAERQRQRSAVEQRAHLQGGPQQDADADDDNEPYSHMPSAPSKGSEGRRPPLRASPLAKALLRAPPRAPCWARPMLALASLGGIALGGTVVLYPASSSGLDFWALTTLRCVRPCWRCAQNASAAPPLPCTRLRAPPQVRRRHLGEDDQCHPTDATRAALSAAAAAAAALSPAAATAVAAAPT